MYVDDIWLRLQQPPAALPVARGAKRVNDET